MPLKVTPAGVGLMSLGALLLWAPLASAQDSAELTETQLKYNEQGTAQSKAGQYEEAVASFKLALAIRDYNLLHLNLGRAYAKRGWCALAKEQYAKVPNSPALSIPTREEVNQVLKAFDAELDKACAGQLKLTCEPGTLRVSIAGAEPIPCPAQPVAVIPGAVDLVGVRGAQTIKQVASVPAGEVIEVTLRLEEPKQDPVTDPVVVNNPKEQPPVKPIEPIKPSRSIRPTIGAVVAGTGVVMLVGALVVDQLVLGPVLDDLDDPPSDWTPDDYDDELLFAEDLQVLNLGLLVTGSVLTVTGMVLWAWPTESAQPAQGLSLEVGPSYAGVKASW